MRRFRCLVTLVFVFTLCSGRKVKHRRSTESPGPLLFHGLNFTRPTKGARSSPDMISPPFQNGQTPSYCGMSMSNPFSDRIVGGTEATPHEFPWMVKLFQHRSFHCGAVLIADRYVLTAGHCVSSFIEGAPTEPRAMRGGQVNVEKEKPSDFVVELGSHRLKEAGTGVTRRKVEKIILHPGYDMFESNHVMLQTNDIAILKIAPVAFTPHIIPICLPMNGAKLHDKTQLMVAGWGSTLTETLGNPNINLPDVLQKTFLTKISDSACKNNAFIGPHFGKETGITNREVFCMIGKNEDSCRGDSGGPAFMKTPMGYVVAGLVSWGLGCNQKDYPAAYTQVASYMDFIIQHTRDGKFLPHMPTT